MATDFMSRISNQNKLFILLLLLLWGLVVGFVMVQYEREKQFKIERVNAQLQGLNVRFLEALGSGESAARFFASTADEFDGLRLTIIDTAGVVRYDSKWGDDALRMSNHKSRPEVAAAIDAGSGYTIKRHSESVHAYYFYSATRSAGIIVRSAVPYTMTLVEALRVGRWYLFPIIIVSLIISLVGYLTSRLTSRLKRAAEQVEIEHARVLHEEREKIRIKRQLTNNINHELKTPICSIQGYLDMILHNDIMDDDMRREFIRKAYSQAERLRLLMQDLSTITRMDEAGTMIAKEPVSLTEVVAEVVDDVSLQAQAQHIAIFNGIGRPITIDGNRMLLYSIFRNLADNAIAYSGGRNISIRLLSEDEQSYTFSFSDNGIGVDAESRPYIFERFYRVDKGRSRKVGGTGLGLSIVKNAVLIHGGTIETREIERGGLEFIFTLKRHS